jgi:tRNA A-37 threonylcarbamoyl transferase component Bud32
MLSLMVVIAKHRELVERLGLDSLAGAKTFQGELVKNHRGRRDIQVACGSDASGHARRLFLKRNWKPYKKDGLGTVLHYGKPRSISRLEWEHSEQLQAAGIQTAALVAYGEDCGPLWERFSFILTEAATGQQTVQSFLMECRDQTLRRRVFEALARHIRKMHDAGLASPDLFTRHVFVEAQATPPVFCLIDMARLDNRRKLSRTLRARDLAALHVTAPLKAVTAWERLRFLISYNAREARTLAGDVQRRAKHLLQRRKFRSFSEPLPD